MDYLDSEGLTYYDSKIKGHIDSVIENSVLPMIPKKGVVALGNNGYVTGGQVYNAIGSGGGGGTVTAEYPFPYVKVKKCKRFVAYSSYSNIDALIYEIRTSDYTQDLQGIDVSNINGYVAFGSGINYGEFRDMDAFDASFSYPNRYHLYTKPSNYTLGASYTSEGEMEIHNYYRIPNKWMTYYNNEESIINPETYSLVAPVLRIDDKIKIIESKALYTHKTNITLYISAVEPPVIQSDTFYGFNAIHVPSGSLDLYKSANNWSAYADYMIGDL